MTERAAWLSAAAGWLLVTWGLAEAIALWVWPLGLGLGFLAVAVLWIGVVRLALIFLAGGEVYDDAKPGDILPGLLHLRAVVVAHWHQVVRGEALARGGDDVVERGP